MFKILNSDKVTLFSLDRDTFIMRQHSKDEQGYDFQVLLDQVEAELFS